MVGVFDPKSEQNPKSRSLQIAASVGAIFVLVCGAGIFAATKFGPERLASKPDKMQTAELISLATIPNAPALAEPEIVLTSFQELSPQLPTEIRSEELKHRDTLTDLLDRLGVDRSEANAALYALYDKELIDPRKVRPGLEISAYLEPVSEDESSEALRLVGLTLKHEKQASLVVSRKHDDSFTAHELHTRLVPTTRRVSGTVETSLYEAALQMGARDAQVYDFAQIFAYDVDFQREMRTGDRFEIVFEEYTDEKGRFVSSGDVLFASLNGYATNRAFYRYTPEDDGVTDYFDAKGESATKFLMKTPINGARLSSNFGYRKHPVLGYNKLHKGTDFAAPSGTPIMAAGNGTIERASWFGSFGNYVAIRHANGYRTAYAHMKGYGPGIRSGARVKQGQVIGYVGTTGRSTGPHLHYEVYKAGKAVNAMTLKLPTGRKLEGQYLADFQVARAEIDQIRGLGETEVLYASASSDETPSDVSSDEKLSLE